MHRFTIQTFWTIGLLGLVVATLTLGGCRRADSRPSQKKPRAKRSRATPSKATELRPTKAASAASMKRPLVPAARTQGTPLAGKLHDLRVDKPQKHDNLTLYPVVVEQQGVDERILTIDAAFKADKIKVTEEGSPTVPSISVRKSSRDKVFIMTGEIFIGANQDRISKHDVLLPPRAGTFRLPVYCVEEGRWHGSSRAFRSGGAVSTQQLRKSAAKKGSQSEVWGKVRSKTGNVRAVTSTNTMQASYRSRLWRKKSPAFLKALKGFAERYPHAQGVLVVTGGTVTSLDLFANHDLFEKLWPKLLKAYVLDAIDPRFKGSPYDERQLAGFVGAISGAKFKRTPNPGLGTEYLLSSADVAGTLLLSEGRIVHLALFPEKQGRKRHFDRSQGVRYRSANPASAADDDDNGSGPINPNAASTKGTWIKKRPWKKSTWKKSPKKRGQLKQKRQKIK